MTIRSRLAPLLAPALVLSLALPAPALAEASRDEGPSREAVRARNLALGLAALAAVAIAARAADRDDEDDGDEDERVLPSACLRPFDTWRDGGAALLHDLDCLDARVERAGDLPLSCAVTVRTREGFETGFDPGCLAEAGWDTE
jgi:hypothetical protein